MKVEQNPPDGRIQFEDVPIGSCFWSNSILYIKTSNMNCVTSGVVLSTGNEVFFENTSFVYLEPRAKVVFDKE